MYPLLVPLLVHLFATSPPDACAVGAESRPAAYAVVGRVAGSDTLATVTICLVADSARIRMGGYHGELSLPSSARVVGIDRPAGGTRIENTTVAGRVSFAGVASAGIASGKVLALTIARRSEKDDTRLRLIMLDVTDVRGREVLALFRVDSLPRVLSK